jgi:undecaprenyl phosphate-alpha-L-ara4FN deformylase
MRQLGLRIDVDTLRGTRVGVPNLVGLLGRHEIRASFFFSVGPDNMGRHLWRLLRPRFLFKMLRTRAASLYGWDILLKGTFWPGPVIGNHCAREIHATAEAGHETGVHAWDHHRWQMRLKSMDRKDIRLEIQKACDLLTEITGKNPDSFAAPGWRMTDAALTALEDFPFRYQSDCRGHAIFRPVIDGRRLRRLQVPATLPTYDELIGRQCAPETYNEHLLSLIRDDQLNILTIHAEVEGIACLDLFEDFLNRASSRGIAVKPLGECLSPDMKIAESRILQTVIPGREGWIAFQEGTINALQSRDEK